MIDVIHELKEVGRRFQGGDLSGGLVSLHEIWSRLPTPQGSVPNAYLVVEYGVAFSLKLRDFPEAWTWANRAPQFKQARHDLGEVEFLIGKVAYEEGKFDVARDQLFEAKRKSRGRIFQG